jgi:hypothetical protein
MFWYCVLLKSCTDFDMTGPCHGVMYVMWMPSSAGVLAGVTIRL